MHFTNEFGIFIAFLALTNPLTTVPLLLAATHESDGAERRRIALLATMASAIILLVALFGGEVILKAFQIDIDAFRIAGGLLIAAVAWAMVTGKASAMNSSAGGRGAIVVPLAIPSLAGPGSIAAAIALGHNAPNLAVDGLELIALLAVCAVNAVVLLSAEPINRLLGEQGMKVVNRLLGLLLLGVAISSILRSLGDFFPAWRAV